MAQGSMTREEREAFLAEVHVGVLAIERPGRGPLALPIWYRFVDGVVEIGMSGNSLKAKLLREAGRATMTSTNRNSAVQVRVCRRSGRRPHRTAG